MTALADLNFLSPQSDTNLHSETTDTKGLVNCAVYLHTSQLSLVLIAPIYG